jgi:O-antigen ligase
MKIFEKLTWLITLLGLIIYGLSFIGYIIPFVNLILFFVAVIVTVNLTWKKLEYGVLIVILELIIGAQGYLFSIAVGNYVLSLRLVLFLIVMIAWLIYAVRQKRLEIADSPFFFPLLALAVIVFAAVGIGYFLGNSLAAVFFDFNGYLYFALALPLFTVCRRPDFGRRLLAVFLGGVLALSLVSLFLFADFYFTKDWARPSLTDSIATESASAEEAAAGKFAFGGIKNRLYDESGKPVEYRWQKDIGLGTISYVSGKFFRVFSSGQIWVLYGFLLATYLIFRRWKKDKTTLYLTIFSFLTMTTLFVSFSRSFWIGAAGGVVLMLFFLPKKRALLITVTLVILFLILAGGAYLAAPTVLQTLSERVSSIFNPADELAGQNRLNLLEPILIKMQNRPLLGHGFGTAVVYESVVPEKQGFIKVFAYEWGYLDQFVKFGLIGLVAYIWLLVKIFRTSRRAIKNNQNQLQNWILVGLLIGLVGMLITHLTSPYLNHPLGIGFVVLVAALSYRFLKTNEQKPTAA